MPPVPSMAAPRDEAASSSPPLDPELWPVDADGSHRSRIPACPLVGVPPVATSVRSRAPRASCPMSRRPRGADRPKTRQGSFRKRCSAPVLLADLRQSMAGHLGLETSPKSPISHFPWLIQVAGLNVSMGDAQLALEAARRPVIAAIATTTSASGPSLQCRSYWRCNRHRQPRRVNLARLFRKMGVDQRQDAGHWTGAAAGTGSHAQTVGKAPCPPWSH